MNKPILLGTVISVILYISIMTLPANSQIQSTPSTSAVTKSVNETSLSVAANLAIQVSNETLKAKEGVLRSAVISFLNSGANVLKTTPTDQPVVKTKISNLINNATQSVEGMEATNAIVGVEINKALKTKVSSTDKPDKVEMITIGTSSNCKPSGGNSVLCDNTVTIK